MLSIAFIFYIGMFLTISMWICHERLTCCSAFLRGAEAIVVSSAPSVCKRQTFLCLRVVVPAGETTSAWPNVLSQCTNSC